MPETNTPTSLPALVGGRYRVHDEIGRGGMATVLRAHDDVLDRPVAIKLLHRHLAHDPAFKERFRREARAAAALSHPNVVSIYDWGEADDDGAYMVLEYVDGLSLRDVLRLRGRVTPSEALALLAPAAAGLAAAHAAGLVHRDVKPENVLVRLDGAVKVTDFGLARAAASSTQTFGGDVIVGSPHYLAPEAVRNEPLDARADVYGLGIVLYELLTGRPPFQGESPLATAVLHTNEAVPAPSSIVDGLPPAIDEVVATATAADPADRFDDAGAFGAALHAAVPEGPVAVDLRDGTRDTVVIPASTAETLITAADHAPAPARERAPRRRRGRRVLWLVVLLMLLGGGAYAAWDQVLAPVTAIPDVTTRSADEASRLLEEAGFRPATLDATRFSLEVPEGHVVAQDPAGEARRGTTVGLVLSAGPREHQLPDLTNAPRDDATGRLEQLELEPKVEEAFSESVEAGLVIRTDPAGGATVAEGSTVTVVVSKGRQPIEVPAVAASSERAATDAIEHAGLVPNVVERRFDDAPAGTVLSQSPAAGEQRFKGDTVDLVVSKGPAPFEVPDVRGAKEKAARKTLESKGLEVRVEYVDTVFFFRRGEVHEQDPGPGREVRKGDTVTIYVWK